MKKALFCLIILIVNLSMPAYVALAVYADEPEPAQSAEKGSSDEDADEKDDHAWVRAEDLANDDELPGDPIDADAAPEANTDEPTSPTGGRLAALIDLLGAQDDGPALIDPLAALHGDRTGERPSVAYGAGLVDMAQGWVENGTDGQRDGPTTRLVRVAGHAQVFGVLGSAGVAAVLGFIDGVAEGVQSCGGVGCFLGKVGEGIARGVVAVFDVLYGTDSLKNEGHPGGILGGFLSWDYWFGGQFLTDIVGIPGAMVDAVVGFFEWVFGDDDVEGGSEDGGETDADDGSDEDDAEDEDSGNDDEEDDGEDNGSDNEDDGSDDEDDGSDNEDDGDDEEDEETEYCPPMLDSCMGDVELNPIAEAVLAELMAATPDDACQPDAGPDGCDTDPVEGETVGVSAPANDPCELPQVGPGNPIAPALWTEDSVGPNNPFCDGVELPPQVVGDVDPANPAAATIASNAVDTASVANQVNADDSAAGGESAPANGANGQGAATVSAPAVVAPEAASSQPVSLEVNTDPETQGFGLGTASTEVETDESPTVSGGQSETVTSDDTVLVSGAAPNETVATDETIAGYGDTGSEAVGYADVITVGNAQDTQVGTDQTIAVTASQQTTVPVKTDTTSPLTTQPAKDTSPTNEAPAKTDSSSTPQVVQPGTVTAPVYTIAPTDAGK